MLCAIWYDLYNLKSVKIPTYVGLLLLVMLETLNCNLNKSNSPPGLFSRFLNCTNGTKLRKVPHVITGVCNSYEILGIAQFKQKMMFV